MTNNSRTDAANAKEVFGAVLDRALHERMRADVVRCDAFFAAIDQHVAGRVVLDIGTGPFALLALRCAKAGARKVYAVEVVPQWATEAQEAVRCAGYAHVVQVFEGYSTGVQLPEKVDVVVHEILGNIASEEGVAVSLVDAGQRLVKAPSVPGWSIPSRAQTLAAPIAFPKVFEAGLPQPPTQRAWRLEQFPGDLLLANPQVWEDLRFDAPLSLQSVCTLHFSGTRQGSLSGLVNFMRVYFDNTDTVQIDTLQQQTTWRVVAVVFAETVCVNVGDVVAITCSADLRAFPSSYDFEVVVHPGTPAAQVLGRQIVALRM